MAGSKTHKRIISTNILRDLSFAGLKATSIILDFIQQETRSQDSGFFGAFKRLHEEALKIAGAAAAANGKKDLGWGFVKNALTSSTKKNTRQKYFNTLPWPQPSPMSFDGLAATVLNVPEKEIQEFLDQVVTRYLKTLRSQWVMAAAFAWNNRKTERVSDKELVNLLLKSPMSRFLNPTLDSADQKTFAAFLNDKNFAGKKSQFYKMDFSALGKAESLPEMYFAPSVTLFHRAAPEQALVPLAIQLNDHVFTPQDGNKWELAKYFVLQGISISFVAGMHATVHFPMDAINALTKSILPEDHVVRQILTPHLYMQLPLNFAVLYIDRSVAHNNQREIYTPFPVTKEGFFQIISAYYQGIPGNSSYPPYRYPLKPPTIHSDYGTFVSGYYDIILQFVRSVVPLAQAEDIHVKRWADEISAHVPGFPDGNALAKDPDLLVQAVAAFIWDVSILHSADHYGYAEPDLAKMPLRLRQPPPEAGGDADASMTHLIYWEDLFRHHMAWEMYFKTTTLVRLIDVVYPFTAAKDQTAAQEFLGQLKRYDEMLKIKRFIPLEDIASSIQY